MTEGAKGGQRLREKNQTKGRRKDTVYEERLAEEVKEEEDKG